MGGSVCHVAVNHRPWKANAGVQRTENKQPCFPFSQQMSLDLKGELIVQHRFFKYLNQEECYASQFYLFIYFHVFKN